MKKMLLSILAAAILVGLSLPVLAAVENVKVGGDIGVKMIYRNNFDFVKDRVGRRLKDQQHFIHSAIRVYVTADLSQNVSTMVRLINERDWETQNLAAAPEDYNDFLLDLGYIKASDLLTKGLTLTVGRQEILLGEGLVVGSAYNYSNYPINFGLRGASNDLGIRKSFDAVKLDYAIENVPVSITAFMAKIDETYGGPVGRPAHPGSPEHPGDVTLYGAALKWAPENFSLEPYFVSKVTAYNEPKDILMTGGVRGEVKLPAVEGLSLKGEYAHQFGDNGVANGEYTGWAGYVGGSYEFPVSMKPAVSLTYSRYSGKKSTDPSPDSKAWVPVYPANIASRIGAIAYPALAGVVGGVPESNAQVIKVGFGLKPLEKLGMSLNYYNLRLVETAPGVSKAVGNEIDLSLTYAYTEDLSFGLDIGYFLKGKAIKQYVGGLTGSEADAANPWQAIASVNVAF